MIPQGDNLVELQGPLWRGCKHQNILIRVHGSPLQIHVSMCPVSPCFLLQTNLVVSRLVGVQCEEENGDERVFERAGESWRKHFPTRSSADTSWTSFTTKNRLKDAPTCFDICFKTDIAQRNTELLHLSMWFIFTQKRTTDVLRTQFLQFRIDQ